MTLTSGFFNSVSGDRKYDARQMGSVFDGVFADGVFPTIGSRFDVELVEGTTTVNIGTGKAWFNKTWTELDAVLNVDLGAGESTLSRIDEVVLEVNTSDAVRANTIKVVKGAAASSPVRPTLTHTPFVNQYSLCRVLRRPGVDIEGSDVLSMVGSLETPHAKAVIDIPDNNFYPAVPGLIGNKESTFLLQAPSDGSRSKVSLENLMYSMQKRWAVGDENTYAHRQNFRGGKNLGSVFTAFQLARIKNGSFEDMFVGDYWVYLGVTYRIVDINYWVGMGNPVTNAPHLVIMPDTVITTAAMHSSNNTAAGYNSMTGRAAGFGTSLANINTFFGAANVLSYRDRITTTVTANGATAVGWIGAKYEHPSELMIHGASTVGFATNSAGVSYPSSIATQQFSLFRLVPRFIKSNASYWLRDAASLSQFAVAEASGGAYVSPLTVSYGYRPFFLVG